ncbi:hypothetical protein D9613_012455 [Agrocybe pediades]|uniref:NAD(P)-binding protein n=1 Tax=Agrocybe pediades TaxID=84607 RepID=A0A8H4VM34_9AGAR|nr:hypothetical protein D9613_012455 [Agrocybe pediades]
MLWFLSKQKKPDMISEEDLSDLHGKVVIVTGSNCGIGYATVQFLARKGAKVYMAARNEGKAREAIKQLKEEDIADGTVEWLELDLEDPRKAKKAAEKFLKKEKRLDVLINNAAVGLGPFKINSDGILDVMTINHVSHFAFTQTLLPLMKETCKEDGSDVRIVNLTSAAFLQVEVDSFAGKESLNKVYGPGLLQEIKTYGISKLANVLYMKELQVRLDAENVPIICTSVYPGTVTTPGTLRFFSVIPYISWLTKIIGPWLFVPQRQGAYTSVFAAASPKVKLNREKYAGAYLEPVAKVGKPTKYGEDMRLAEELWETTESVLKEIGVL